MEIDITNTVQVFVHSFRVKLKLHEAIANHLSWVTVIFATILLALGVSHCREAFSSVMQDVTLLGIRIDQRLGRGGIGNCHIPGF